MSFIFCRRGFALLSIALLGLCVPASRAEYIMSVQQVGSNVVTTGSGTLDTTNLTLDVTGDSHGEMIASEGILAVGSSIFQPADAWHGVSGPAGFGPGTTEFVADTGSGPVVAISEAFNNIVFPEGYVSGTVLALSTDTYNNQTFASLGLTPGTYKYTWGTGIHADDLIVQIGAATSAAPLPRTFYFGIIAMPFIFLFRKRLTPAASPVQA